jgi:hypothetical protein
MVAFVVFGGIGIAALASHLNNMPTKTGREICQKVTAAQKAEIMQIATKMHVFPGRIGGITEVDERVWAELPRDSKTALALAVYCDLGVEKTDLLLRGWRDGETKASIQRQLFD